MKKSISLVLTLCILMVTVLCQIVVAQDASTYRDSGDVEITTSGGKEVRLVGHVSPTIVTVTMPSHIPFDISFGAARQNKVVSPLIEVENHSNVPVSIAVDNTRIDLGDLQGSVEWRTSENVEPNGLAIGFNVSSQEPTYLTNAKWLSDGTQDLQLMTLNAQETQSMFVVGGIGSSVPQQGTFTVTPTLVVKKLE